MKLSVFVIVIGLIVALSGFSSGSKEKDSIGPVLLWNGGAENAGD